MDYLRSRLVLLLPLVAVVTVYRLELVYPAVLARHPPPLRITRLRPTHFNIAITRETTLSLTRPSIRPIAPDFAQLTVCSFLFIWYRFLSYNCRSH